MKKLIILIMLLTPILSAATSFVDWLGGCGGKVNNFCKTKVSRVYDGDTFYVTIPFVHSLFGKDLGIRIKGIDTPELRGGTVESKARGIKARDFAANLLTKAKRVDLKDCVRGKFFRIVCDVYLDGKSLGKELLKAKLAITYDK